MEGIEIIEDTLCMRTCQCANLKVKLYIINVCVCNVPYIRDHVHVLTNAPTHDNIIRNQPTRGKLQIINQK